jgi:hypothetical protein
MSVSGTAKARRSRSTLIFICYAAALFIATHWPNLRIESVRIKRPDLIVHLTVFSIWTILLFASGLVRRSVSASATSPNSPSQREGAGGRVPVRHLRSQTTILRLWLIGVLYAAFDEGTQAIPILGRTAAWDDYLFNVMGVTLGALLCAAWLLWRSPRQSELKSG